MLGCDPEFFFKRKNEIIGAEKVLPVGGLKTKGGKIIIDGVQGELNPNPSTNPDELYQNILDCFSELKNILSEDTTIDTSVTVEVSESEMQSLDDKSKQFGCAPSLNTSGVCGTGISDASKYLKRSAGGHIHLGHNNNEKLIFLFKHEPEKVVNVLDIVVGNTCVILDRDEGNIERRKTYGRAGEYRLPPHGLEYRTLSNFWLKDKKSFDRVITLVDVAISILLEDRADELIRKVDMDKIHKAINENNLSLSISNFDRVRNLMDNYF